jgi:hypothetical protein
MPDIGGGRGEHPGGVLDLLLNHAEVLLGAKIFGSDGLLETVGTGLDIAERLGKVVDKVN